MSAAERQRDSGAGGDGLERAAERQAMLEAPVRRLRHGGKTINVDERATRLMMRGYLCTLRYGTQDKDACRPREVHSAVRGLMARGDDAQKRRQAGRREARLCPFAYARFMRQRHEEKYL